METDKAKEENQDEVIDTQELQSILKSEMDDAKDYIDQIGESRAEATEYYLGNEPEANSSLQSEFNSTDVRDSILFMLPSIMRTFFGTKKVVEFVPRNVEDIPFAEQQTSYVNYIIQEKNSGFKVLYDAFKDALVRTFKASGTILTITFGATVLAGAYSLAGGPTYVAETILAYDLKPMYLIFMMQIMFLIMGAFMDWVGIVLLAMPVFLPIVIALGMDPIWFGILFCVNMQVSFLSPPFGPAAFYLKSVAPPHISLTDIFRGFAPFIVIQLIVLACVMFFPEAMTQNFHEFKPKP